MDFEQILPHLKNGQRVSRTIWPEHTFIFRQVPSTIPADVIPKMQSLPQSVKDEFVFRFGDESFQIDRIYYSDQIAQVNVSNLIVGFSPSVSDIFATDWILEEEQ